MASTGKLVLVGTPIGNREDLSPRARRALFEADLLFCEDTRSPLRLVGDEAERLPPRVSCFVGNEHERVAALTEALQAGKTVAYVSEAGMPVWSDPGRWLVEAAWACGATVDVVPGPTAAATALAVSGFDATGSVFAGFVERSGKARNEALAQWAQHPGPVIFYEAGNRTVALLRDLAKQVADGGRRVLVARELTKKHQELIRGELEALGESLEGPLRGEVCVVLEGAGSETTASQDAGEAGARAVLEAMLDASLKPRARAKRVAELTGLDAKEVYERLSKARDR